MRRVLRWSRVRRQDLIRGFSIAILAASLSLAGPGALASEPGRLAQQAREGQSDQREKQQPFVARPAPSSVRVALRPRGASLDEHGGRQLTAALAARARQGAAASQRLRSETEPRHDPWPVPTTVRSSRGPPQG